MQFYIIVLWKKLMRWCNNIYHTFVYNFTILNCFKFIKTIVQYDVEHQKKEKKANDDDKQSEHF